MSTAIAKPNGVATATPPVTVVETVEQVNPLQAERDALVIALREATESLARAPKAFDSYFSIEHQGRLAVKYSQKYSAVEQEVHVKTWPEFKGNYCTLYILAESTYEARKAVFSANRPILVASITAAISTLTATPPGAVLTDMQVQLNKISDMQLTGIAEQIPDEEQRTDLLKVLSKNLKQSSKTGKDIESNKLKFFHAALVLGCKTPSTLW